MINRTVEQHIITDLTQGSKLIVVLGARQVGKTTLVEDIIRKLSAAGKKILYLNCDVEEHYGAVNTTSLTVLTQLLQGLDMLFIDEAQRLDDPGLSLKVIHDNFPKIKVLVTGSSSFEMRNKLSDPLTGRVFEYKLFPLSFAEIMNLQDDPEQNRALLSKKATAMLPAILTYGLYPDVSQEPDPIKKQRLLVAIMQNYLFKDVLAYADIKNSQVIQDLAKALAYQLGSEVNENELAKRLRVDRKTVARYIDILEKAFVVIRLNSYSSNLRREIGKKYKVYFVDLGIRNALIGDFNQLDIRADTGALWENFLVIERMKFINNNAKPAVSHNFWRNYDGAEVDYVEKPYSGPLLAFEFKYQGNALSRGSYSFTRAYGEEVKLININNYLGFITETL